MFRYRFTIRIQDKIFRESCKMMRKLDLSIGEVGVMHTIQFISEKDAPISEVKRKIVEAIESSGIEEMKVLHIEGGKIE